MFSVDIPKVKGKMAERSYTITSLSQSLGISRITLRKYLNNPHTMPYQILNQMAVLLCENTVEAASIFLGLTFLCTKKKNRHL